MKSRHLHITFLCILFFILVEFSIIRGYVFDIAGRLTPFSPKDGSRINQFLLDFSYENALSHPEITKVIAYDSLGLKDKKKLSDALALLKQCIKKSPSDHELYYLFAKVENALNPGSDTTMIFLKKAHSLNPVSLLYNKELADSLMRREDYDEALKYFNRIVSIKNILPVKLESLVFCEVAQIYLVKNDNANFINNLDRANKLWPQNWMVDFLTFRHMLDLGKLKPAMNAFKSSYDKYLRHEKDDPLGKGPFQNSINNLAKILAGKGRFNYVRYIYDNLAVYSQDPERILLDLNRRFENALSMKNKIWGERISLQMLNPMFSEGPLLQNFNRSCPTKELDHKLESSSESEVLQLKYFNSAGFLDIWYLPSSIPLKSEKMSVQMEIESDENIESRQIAIEILGNFYYSRGEVVKRAGNVYLLMAENVIDYALKDLLTRPKGYELYITKIGFNTVCNSGRYKIKSISIYLQD